MARRNENWLLVEWATGGRDVVYSKSVLHPLNRELKIGEKITVSRRGDPHSAILIARAKERDDLEPRETVSALAAGPSPKPDEEPEDYSPSGSSWAPSEDGAVSADSDKEIISAKKIKLEHCKRQYMNRKSGKKELTPMYRANAVIPISMQQDHSKNDSRTRTHKEKNYSLKKSLPDSTKRNNYLNTSLGRSTIDTNELEEIGNSFRLLFNMLEDLKKPLIISDFRNDFQQSVVQIKQNSMSLNAQAVDEEENDPYDPEEEFNRSDDNVLITNKYDSQYNESIPLKDRVKSAEQPTTEAENSEWVPIGSGKTLIHKDQFRKVNWKSYTIATRTLLLAVFPRRILATHSLTGKRSPAFQNKPAKMCLDPKIISDVIMEITDRFDVKENLVRSIITTKCADECKMLKQKNKKNGKASIKDKTSPKNEFQKENQVPLN